MNFWAQMMKCSFLFAGLILFDSCRKLESETPADVSMANLTVPAGFTWEMSKATRISVPVTDTRFGDAIHVIAIYDDNGKLISKGSARISSPFESTVSLPTNAKRVYLIKTAPDGSRTTKEMVVNGEVLTIPMGIADAAGKNGGNKISGGPDPVGPDCNTGVDETVIPDANTLQTITITNGKTVALSGQSNTSKIYIIEYGIGGGTLRICGANVTIKMINYLYSNDEFPQDIVIASGADVIFENGNSPYFGKIAIPGKLTNYGNVKFRHIGTISHYNDLVNYGTLLVEADCSYQNFINGSPGNSANYGTMQFVYSFRFSNGRFTNQGSFIGNNFSVGSDFVNECKLTTQSLYVENLGKIINTGNAYISTNNLELFGTLLCSTNSLVTTNNLYFSPNTVVHQQSGMSVIKIYNALILSGIYSYMPTFNISGDVRICFANGTNSGINYLPPGTQLSCNAYIPVSLCNDVGNGTATVGDSDNDGIANALDDYPDDVTRAFTNPGATGTLVFEDQWPKRGDYDMNDVVISYNYTVITDANNKVTQVQADYSLKAAGGKFDNGFGVEFPVNRTSIASLEGATLEPNQTKAVAILFTSMHTELPQWNTRSTDVVTAPKTYHLELNIATGIDLSVFGLSSYNPFIWNNGLGYGRGNEIHLLGKPPTSLANMSLFGQFSDLSTLTGNGYYLTATGFPWGLDIPGTSFKHPLEESDIGLAYPKLAPWVLSGGTQFADWYSNTSGEYRNNAHIFNP